ncbi:hypothetical protein [Streptomyces sp. NPDC047985]|uniref:hypothetical protein n=1 Tax=Streptomyces sp. NPDC047985 TaxID=3155384 RepID=UPI0034122C73
MTTQIETAEYRWTAFYWDGLAHRSATGILAVPTNLTENELRARAHIELRRGGRIVNSCDSLTLAPTTETKPQEVFFEITTLDGARYRKGQLAPSGTVTTETGENIPVVVQGYELDGDWVEIQLSDGYAVAFTERRVDRAVTRTL